MDSKQKILDGLRRLLLNQGHQGLSIRALANEAGVNHGLVHHYFGSKEGAIKALMDQVTTEKLQQVIQRIQTGPTEEITEAFVDLWIKDEDFGRLILEFNYLGTLYPQINLAIQEITQQRRYFLTQVFGLEESEALLFQSVIVGIQLLRRELPVSQVEEAANELFRIYPLGERFNPDKLKAMVVALGAG